MPPGPDGIARMYDQFAPPERLTLLLEAMARGDGAEAERLRRSCPRKTYSQLDADFDDRLSLAFDTMAVACIDLRGLWGKLHVLEWAVEAVGHFAALHHITAEMAFLDGTRCARGRPQMPFFSKELWQPAAGEAEGGEVEADAGEDDAGDDAGGEGGESEDGGDEEAAGLSGPCGPGDGFADRMEAVERRAEHATACVLAVLRGAAGEAARQFVEVWEAFGRFSRARVGVGPEVLLDAWDFPLASNFKAVLKKYAGVKPDPAAADELLGCIVTQWDQRFGPAREE